MRIYYRRVRWQYHHEYTGQWRRLGQGTGTIGISGKQLNAQMRARQRLSLRFMLGTWVDGDARIQRYS